MLSNKKIIELFNRLKSRKNAWLGMRDSNPRSRDQNPLPYHLANPQYLTFSLSSSRTPILKGSDPEHGTS